MHRAGAGSAWGSNGAAAGATQHSVTVLRGQESGVGTHLLCEARTGLTDEPASAGDEPRQLVLHFTRRAGARCAASCPQGGGTVACPAHTTKPNHPVPWPQKQGGTNAIYLRDFFLGASSSSSSKSSSS